MNVIQENWEEIHAEAEKRAIRLGIPKERVLRLEALIMPGIQKDAELINEAAEQGGEPTTDARATTAAHEMMAKWAFGIELLADAAETFGRKNAKGERISKEYLWGNWENFLNGWLENHAPILSGGLHSEWEVFKAAMLESWQ